MKNAYYTFCIYAIYKSIIFPYEQQLLQSRANLFFFKYSGQKCQLKRTTTNLQSMEKMLLIQSNFFLKC